MNANDVLPIYGHTQVAAVIGWPIEHSVSPPMHNAAFRALGMDWCYVAFAVPPEHLAGAIAGARALGVRGMNVTVPHKQALLPLMDELTPAAMAIGAANTVIMADGRLRGHNTDAAGFSRALREAGVATEGIRALVLGAGGAARAVVYALAMAGAQITLLNRTPERAAALAAEFGDLNPAAEVRAGALDAATLARVAPAAQLVVNTTPLGMWPHVDRCPWPDEVPYPAGAFCYDLIYNPRETALMARARAAGAGAADGLGMLVHQGAEAFECWTGVAAPVDVMHRACAAILAGG